MHYLFCIFILGDISLALATTPATFLYLTVESKSLPNSELKFKSLMLNEANSKAIHKRSAKDESVNSTMPKPEVIKKLSSVPKLSEPLSNSQLKRNNSAPVEYSLPTDAFSGVNKQSISDASVVSAHDGLPFEVTNDTLKQHNITRKSEDYHVYYNSSIYDEPAIGEHFWVNMSNRSETVTHQMLSKSHRRAVTVPLPFKFQFYGHEIQNVTIATGGFLYTGDYIHSWLAATQYIAPLMANFDTGLSNSSFIRYLSNETAFSVMWENVLLQECPNAGNFTFQVTLYKSGDIIFVYKNIPMSVDELTEDFHPVKVGLSDAYILEKALFFVRRKTIFEYHRVQIDKAELKNWTVIHLIPLPTCHNRLTCETCLSKNIHFECQWCEDRCSTGVDRRRQDWIQKECDKHKVNETKYCGLVKNVLFAGAHKTAKFKDNEQKRGTSKIAIVLILAVATGFAFLVWTLYAYRNPHSTSGQILIRYRPNQWSSWRKGEARYTAATIHM